MILGLLLAFAGGHVIAWVYMWTHTGLSYSRSFVNSLILLPIVVALVMMVLANNLVTAFGLMAVFAIVRFRNILRDTLDTTYVLCVIVIGMAAGTLCFWACTSLKQRFNYDDTLDVFGVHGIGGITGTLLVGVFASAAITAHCRQGPRRRAGPWSSCRRAGAACPRY